MKPLDSAAHIASLMSIEKSVLPRDGGERFNRLIFARSPYLLQHAENPVDWYEWGDAPFARARSENLPILLSIGYATCHWCHVMAHESFEDAEVAALLNRHFVCIKVDREERPDIDDFHMAVAQALTGSGGWPLNIFMTPEKRPFMAITYLPKRGRDGMSGLMELLANIATLWRQQPELIERNCRSIMEALEQSLTIQANPADTDLVDIAARALRQLNRIYDHEQGGFGSAPKFPMPIYLGWLIGQKGSARNMAFHTLKKMRAGGIWDQLGGGLHRYSVDRLWLAPHFEKMLYDQAMLAQVTIEAYKATGDTFYRTMTEDLLAFVERELLSGEGAFCSALDADSEGVEGTFYLWKKSDIEACLGEDAALLCRYHPVSEAGNFEGENILTAPLVAKEFCQQNGMSIEETTQLLDRCRTRLLTEREQRIRPLRDDKIITSWNGLMISAFAAAGVTFNKPEHITRAAAAASFILGSLRRNDGRLLRSYLNGASDVPAFLEDYAFLAGGLLDLYEATLNQAWLNESRLLADDVMRLFRDPESGAFNLTGHDAEQMPIRVASDHDGVTPSALSRTAMLFYRLGWIDDRQELLDAARRALSEITAVLPRSPLGHLGALQVLSLLDTTPAIATFTGDTGTADASVLIATLRRYNFNSLIIRCVNPQAPLSLTVCLPGTCLAPVSNITDLKELLRLHGVQEL